MTDNRSQQIIWRAGDLKAAVRSLMQALQRDIDVVSSRRQDAVVADIPDDMQQLTEQRDRWSRDLSVLQDQVATLERLASGGVREGREAAALTYIDKLAQALLLAVEDIKGRAGLSLSPSMIERLPAWEVESARASVADTECATALLKQVLDR